MVGNSELCRPNVRFRQPPKHTSRVVRCLPHITILNRLCDSVLKTVSVSRYQALSIDAPFRPESSNMRCRVVGHSGVYATWIGGGMRICKRALGFETREPEGQRWLPLCQATSFGLPPML